MYAQEKDGCGDHLIAAAVSFCLQEAEHGKEERELLHLLREIQYGEVRIIIQAGTPVRIEEIRKSIQL